jgi:alpha-methylacyl-CoA racemase
MIRKLRIPGNEEDGQAEDGQEMGPLHGVKILEVAGIGPGPFAAMMLSDMGAEVLRIDRAHGLRAVAIPRLRRPIRSRAAGAALRSI